MQIGEILKEQREAKNLSLDDIQEETKIQKRYLAAIEQDDFQALPGKFYARAFIKEYAQEVGLDPDELLEGFDEQAIETEEPVPQYTRMDQARHAKNARRSSFWSSLPTIIVIVLFIGILFVAWVLINQKSNAPDNNNLNEPNNNEKTIQENRDDRSDNDDQTNQEEGDENNQMQASNDNNHSALNDEDEADDDDEFSIVEEGTGDFPESTLDFTYHGDEAEVAFDVSDDTYVELQGEDGESYLAETLKDDDEPDTYDVTDDESILIKVGNAKGTSISINDVELEYPVDTDTVTQKLQVNLEKED